jgi:hypothetical protein
MGGIRINNVSLETITYPTAKSNDAIMLVDWDGAAETASLPIKLIGNTFAQGSYDKVTWNNTILSDHTYVKVSTDGIGSNYLIFDVSYNSDNSDLHKSLTLGTPTNGLILDKNNQILSLDWDGVINLSDIGDFPIGATNQVFVKIDGGYSFIALPHSYLTDFNIDTNYVHLTQAQKDNLIQAASTISNGYMTSMQVNSLERKADTYTIILPASTTINGRIINAIEGINYPIGWVLDDTDEIDLRITHNINKRISTVTVWSMDVEGDRQLYGNAAFSGILAESTNILKIESLATVESYIVIQLVF